MTKAPHKLCCLGTPRALVPPVSLSYGYIYRSSQAGVLGTLEWFLCWGELRREKAKEVKRSSMTRMYIQAGVGAASLVIFVLIHLRWWSGDGPSKQQDMRLCKEIMLIWFCQADGSWKIYIVYISQLCISTNCLIHQ